ncbi:hypothetical protein M407DRAFT_23908 [Tulasnella calospora MUT 4182]|uniref:F-box domain-containing protein n=1 Tax=Tulasnella calospora MUT 4182 TaxID=1051891 RepID=A0A0C3QKE7_9AGAM|nr:hypothetical protein M407DRAFT_23908 [Tulasnella calospora MUT 4182]
MARHRYAPYFKYGDIEDYETGSDDTDNDETDDSDSVSEDEGSGSSSQTSSIRAANHEFQFDPDKNIQPNRKNLKSTVPEADMTPRYLMEDIFSTLPLDVVHEVLGHLHPLDLLHLARTNKVLRFYLMSKCLSSSTWKKAREAVVPAVPQCPKDQSEPQWAALLFTQECTRCGTAQVRKIEWTLRLRGCKPCFVNNFFFSQGVASTFPDIENVNTVLELIPYARTSGYRPLMRFYFLDHVKKMAKIIEDYSLRIDAAVEGARGEFDEFVDRKKAEVTEQVESGKTLKKWAQEAARMRRVINDEIIKERKQAMIAKLTGLGYDMLDVRAAARDNPYNGTMVFRVPRPLSDAEWERVRPSAEMMVQKRKNDRLQKEMMIIQQNRQRVALLRYADFKKAYNASPDRLLPEGAFILGLPIITQIIQSDGDDIDPTIFDEAFKDLPALIDEWRRVRRVDLARMILEAQGGSDDAEEDLDAAEREGILHLATSIFVSCAGLKGLRSDAPSVHWLETIHERKCVCHVFHSTSLNVRDGSKPKYDSLRCIEAVPDWVALAKELVQAAGLDPRTATVKDMDDCNARFWCKDCSWAKWKGNVARNWRNCIAHIGFHGKPSSCQGYRILSADDRAVIEAKETALATLQEIDWNTIDTPAKDPT